MKNADYLAQMRELCECIFEHKPNHEAARICLLQMLSPMGLSIDHDDLCDPEYVHWLLKIIIDMQKSMDASAANASNQTESSLCGFPAWELTRAYTNVGPREDWVLRWRAAGGTVSWEGALPGNRMVALKTSPIWQALGNGAGGFRDTLGNPYPPFAFGSGLAWDSVPRQECIDLGLIPEFDDSPLTDVEKELAAAAERYGLI